MSDKMIIIGKNTHKLFLEAKRKIGFESDSVTVAELCLKFLNPPAEPKMTYYQRKRKEIMEAREPFHKGEIVYLFIDDRLKRGKILEFTKKGKIHIALDDGALLEFQEPDKVYHEWDVGYADFMTKEDTK